MTTINFNNPFKKVLLVLALIILFLPGCEKDYLKEVPKDSISEDVFWNDKDEAYMALMGCYDKVAESGWTERVKNIEKTMIWMSAWAGYGSWRNFEVARGIEIVPTHITINSVWQRVYRQISRDNYFLDNIDKVDMDEDEKAEMAAEARFLRAFSYFWLSQLYGNVPLSTTTLTFDEANNVSQSSEEEVENFVLSELTAIAPDLPVERPAAETGRIERGAALALKGRLLMAQERWSEAASVYEEIMGLNRYIIDPRFKELFEDEGENSDEIIFAVQYMENEYGESATQGVMRSSLWGGYNSVNVYKILVDAFLMTDGLPIEDSPLYDPDQPFENRDPRFYATLFLPGYSTYKGEVFHGHPDTIARTGQTGPNITGYIPNKFFDHDYEGNPFSYGGDYAHMRYAEVLLSRLESELKAGNAVDQNLLDNTINQVRGRDAVNMPPVTTADYASDEELMEIISRERFVELAFEGGIRYFDLRRWGKLQEVVDRDYYGMKITDDPDNYTGKYSIDEEGHVYCGRLKFFDYNDLWPIPLDELDVNDNLEQNPGYQ